MIKKNMLLTIGLIASVATTALPMYKDERAVLHAMHALGKDFTAAEFVVQNVDMFINIFKIHSDLLETKLAVADQKAKKALWTMGGSIVGTSVGSILLIEGWVSMLNPFNRSRELMVMNSVIQALLVACRTGINLHFGLDVYNAFKERNTLKEALVVDTEILNKLEELKASMAFDELAETLPVYSADAQDAVVGQDVAAEVAEVEELDSEFTV